MIMTLRMNVDETRVIKLGRTCCSLITHILVEEASDVVQTKILTEECKRRHDTEECFGQIKRKRNEKDRMNP